MSISLTIAGINLIALPAAPFEIKWQELSLEVYTFVVSTERSVLREELKNMIGHHIGGREIVGVESFCIEEQRGRKIGLAFKVSTD